MKHHLRTVFLFVFLLIAVGCLKVAIPSNDLIRNATDPGLVPVANGCPYDGKGDVIGFFSTISEVSFNPVKVSAIKLFSKVQNGNNYDNMRVELSH